MNMQSMDQSLYSLVLAHPWFIAVIVWSVIWKLIALWKSARNNHMTVFIVLAFLNTAGLAEIVYLVWLHLRNKKDQDSTASSV